MEKRDIKPNVGNSPINNSEPPEKMLERIFAVAIIVSRNSQSSAESRPKTQS